MVKFNKVSFLAVIFLALCLGFFAVTKSSQVHALTGSDFQAGHIIDDAVFTDTASMSVTDINNFLAAKVPSCDTSGSQLTNHPNGSGGYYTRAQWGAIYDSQNNTTIAAAPYVCLKDYLENPNTHQTNLQGATVSGGVTPGEIIYYAALHYHINPQVILTTLQKEQGLVTDDWPWTNEYRAAMGFNCPDNGTGCSGYAGFAIQVNAAAAQMRNYLDNPSNYNFISGQNNTINYYPCPSGTTVFIQNQATAALYDYTPYQPDPGVLQNTNPTGSSAGPGSVPYADSCATYGNRNFWWYFNTWFGSTFAINGSIQLVSSLVVSPASALYVNDTVTGSYQVKNTASYDIDAGGLGVCARINGQNYDFGFSDHTVIPAGQTISISYSKRINIPGNLNVFMCSYNTALGWANLYYPYDINGGLTRQVSLSIGDNPLITSGIELGPSNPGILQPVDAYLTIKNSSASDINIGSLVIAARDPQGNNVDFPIKNDVIIPAGTTQNLKWTRTFATPGNYTFFVASWNGIWTTSYPHSAGTIIRQLNWPILDNPLVSSGISLSASPTIGQPVSATIGLRNTSPNSVNIGSLVIAARDNSGKNYDFPIKNDVTIPANATINYTWTQTFTIPGTYTLFIANWNNVWTTLLPKSLDNSVVRTTTVTLQ